MKGSFSDAGTPVLLTRTISVAAPWTPTTRAQRDIDTTCYEYVTRTAKGSRPLPDGTWESYTYQETVRVPMVRERATTTRKTTRTVREYKQPETARIKLDHDFNN